MTLPPPKVEIDARGFHCPVPTLKLQKALQGLAAGEIVQLRADDPMAKVDVPHFANQTGHEVLSVGEEAGALVFLVRKASGGD
jgi:tRNA 2-thiouridine synthesizing protein A